MDILRRSSYQIQTAPGLTNRTSSQESVGSNGFTVSDRPKLEYYSAESSNDIDISIHHDARMSVPVAEGTDVVSGILSDNMLQPSHHSSQTLSPTVIVSNTSPDGELLKSRSSAEKRLGAAESYPSNIDKLDGSGDNFVPSTSGAGQGPDTRTMKESIDGMFDRSLDKLIVKLGDKSSEAGSEIPGSLEVSGKSSLAENGSKSGNEGEGKKKRKSWYSVLNPTYKSRTQELRKLFKHIPSTEHLIVDYSCAYQKDILLQGRMYITENYVCFYANIFTWETCLLIRCEDIIAVTKEKTARVIPNAIQITTKKDKMFFTSFTSRDKAFLMVFRIWQNTLLNKKMSKKELWNWVKFSYGNHVGITASEEEYASHSGFDEPHEKSIKAESTLSVSKNYSQKDNGDERLGLSSGLKPIDLHSSNVSLDTSVVSDLRNNIEGDSSGADSPGEVVCSDHDHLEKTYLNEAFDLPVDQVFEFLFSDSKFFRDFCTSRKTFKLQLPDWQSEPNSEGDREREIHYTLTLSASIGPKHSPSYERQVYHGESQPGFIYVIDSHVYNGGIPYADAFYVTNRYCLTRITRHSCRVRVTSQLHYTKSIWSLVKTMIDKNAKTGLTAYFQQLESHLRRESKKYEELSPPRPSQKKPTRKRQKTADQSLAESDRYTSEPSTPTRRSRMDIMFGFSAENLVRLLCFVLVLLFLFNAVLFYKLFYLESVAESLYACPISDDLKRLATETHSSDDWLLLLTRQQHLHQLEVDKWRDVIGSSIVVIDQIRDSFAKLQTMLAKRRPHVSQTLHSSGGDT